MMLQEQGKLDDFVVATNEAFSVSEFCRSRTPEFGLERSCKGGSSLLRPAEVDISLAMCSKARGTTRLA